MEKWKHPKQPLSLSLFLVIIIGTIFSICIAFYISSWTGDSILIGSLIKGVIVFIAFSIIFYVQAKISDPIHYYIHVIFIGIIAFFIIFFLPLYLEIQNPQFDYNNIQYQTYSLIAPHPYYQASQGGLFPFISYLAMQSFFVGLAIIGGVYSAYMISYSIVYDRDVTVYSEKYEKFYKLMYQINYNVYVNDYLKNLSKTLDFNIVIQFLNDKQRIQKIPRAKKEFFQVFNLPENGETYYYSASPFIIRLHKGFYQLSQEESVLLSDTLDKEFGNLKPTRKGSIYIFADK